jgi:hypothetical protein
MMFDMSAAAKVVLCEVEWDYLPKRLQPDEGEEWAVLVGRLMYTGAVAVDGVTCRPAVLKGIRRGGTGRWQTAYEAMRDQRGFIRLWLGDAEMEFVDGARSARRW